MMEDQDKERETVLHHIEWEEDKPLTPNRALVLLHLWHEYESIPTGQTSSDLELAHRKRAELRKFLGEAGT
jgi:hypothetical protein